MLAEPVLIDTGAFAALFDRGDEHYAASRQQFSQLPLGKSFTCWPVVVEAAYLIGGHVPKRNSFLDAIALGEFPLLHLDESDVPEIQDILRKYADQQIDLADAALVHLANREGIRVVFTFDRRHFQLFRSVEGSPFHLIP